MGKFLKKHIFQPLAGRWLLGVLLLLFWTISFLFLPALSGWFLAASSVAFITANTMFAYLIPSSIIRLMTILRTASRYFERLQNHKSTLDAQRRLQLRIFESVARFPYFKKQVNNNSSILENSTHGIDLILNHILLWILPLAALVISILLYGIFLIIFSKVVAIEFLFSSAVLLFLVPQYILGRNRMHYQQLKNLREENNQALIQSFRGRIEIEKYHLEDKAIHQHTERMLAIERLERKLQTNSFTLQLLVGLGFSLLALFLLWSSAREQMDASLAIGIFFGILAQAELAEMLFAGKSEKSSVTHQINDLHHIITEGEKAVESKPVDSPFGQLQLAQFCARVPESPVKTEALTLDIKKGDWIALYGETGKGKTTFLNSLFYPEYRLSGEIVWNETEKLAHLPVPQCIYVTQKAYLLTGTLRENFQDYPDEEIIRALETVDLISWFEQLPDGLNSWLGENGETLSGGQRKKLLLAQALLKNPQLLIVDEPTAGISSESAISIFQTIRQRYSDITILMATHLKDFENVVDKVVRM